MTRYSSLLLPMLLVAVSAPGETEAFRIGAFNLKIFGQTKIEDVDVVNNITQIIKRYDLVLLQEIRDSSETAIYTLLDSVNSLASDPYSMVVSERLGNSVSKEQYAYMYKESKMHLLEDYVYSDPGNLFEREPYVAVFSTSQAALSKFAIVGIHTRPSAAFTEIDHLVDVYEEIRTTLDLEDVIFAGDFNGDCSYVANYRWDEIRLRTNPLFKWLIEDDEDTTVSNTDCAYDRFVIAGQALQSAVLPCSASVFKFEDEYGLTQEQALLVSDHYPIEMTLLPPEFKDSQSGLRIGAFNIQIFGTTKADKPEVMAILVQIVKRYDVILIQEIRDSSETAVPKLLDMCNSDNPDPFESVVSSRLGRTSSKEQYAYFYRPSKVTLMSSMVYNDTEQDIFQREPFLAHFKSEITCVKDFVLVGIHTQPDDARTEINHLVDVYDFIGANFGIEDVILMGDFNADCTYVSNRAYSDLRLKTDQRFCWLMDKEEDTTVSDTDCAYDRFVVAGTRMVEGIVPYSASTFRFDLEYSLTQDMALDVSDHYPVEMQLRADMASGDGEIISTPAAGGASYSCRYQGGWLPLASISSTTLLFSHR